MEKLVYSVQEIATMLGISKSHAYALSKEGKIPTLMLGSKRVIPREKFIKWFNEQGELERQLFFLCLKRRSMNMRNIEYDKPYTNTMEIRNTGRKQRMKEIMRDADYGDRTIKVVLQFPDEPQDAKMIQDEVRAILMMELQEQMKNML